jgi:general L-amino acid transport system ATP-binding protein
MNAGNKNQSIIIARNIHKWYGHFEALKGISMEVKKGEVIVIFGPSGSGKSTFIRTINRLEEHQEGQIIVDGIELTHDVHNIEAVRMETGMVFQQFNLFPHMSVLQNITIAPIQVRKWKKEKAEEIAQQLLERVGINFQVDSNNALPLHAPWPCSPRSCSSTNPHLHWIPK